VVDGVMYVTGPNTAAALDTRTGRELWSWKRPIPKDYQNIGFGRVNRGPAILDDQIFVATLDCSGKPLWDFQTGGPIAANPISFRIDGRQCVAIAAGRALYVFSL
jgi:alcohol dehydrogenase (cytochrome c)